MVKALIIAKFVASFKSFLNTKINKIKVANELLITLFNPISGIPKLLNSVIISCFLVVILVTKSANLDVRFEILSCSVSIDLKEVISYNTKFSAFF